MPEPPNTPVDSASEYLPMFLAECRESLQELNLAVIRLEEAPEDPGAIDAIFRVAHSLKGMAATMGYEGMARLTHRMEDVFDLFRQRGAGLPAEVVTVVLAVLDGLERAVASIEDGRGEALDPQSLIDLLGALVRDSDDGSPAIPASTATYDVQVVLAADAPMPSVRAFQLFQAAAEHGVVVSTQPTESELEGWRGTVVELVVALPCDLERLELAARDVADVTDIRIAERVQDAGADVELAVDRTNTVRVDASRLESLGYHADALLEQVTRLQIHELTDSAHALRDLVAQIRKIPVEVVFMRFPRLVRDVATRLDKRVSLRLVGQETELDRSVVAAIGGPLVHVLRNSLDHGLEQPAERVAAGKAPTGTLTLAAARERDSIVITVTDDGRGIDPAVVSAVAVKRGILTASEAAALDPHAAIELLFAPGFSTVDEVSDLSGRGVGMDAVRAKLRELGGEVSVSSVLGHGTVTTLRVPLAIGPLADNGPVLRAA